MDDRENISAVWVMDHADRDVWSAKVIKVISQSHPPSILTCHHWSSCHWLTNLTRCDITDHNDPLDRCNTNTTNSCMDQDSEVPLKYMRLDTVPIIWLSVVHCPSPHCATSVDPLSILRTAAAQLTHGWVYHSVQTKKEVEVSEEQVSYVKNKTKAANNFQKTKLSSSAAIRRKVMIPEYQR